MFGQPDTTDNTTSVSVPAVDPSVMADPASVPAPAPAVEHPLTPAYPEETVATQAADSISAATAGLGSDDPVSSPAPAISTHAPAQPAATSVSQGAIDDELLAIKQNAMTALSPLVGNLEQSPEEKFRTTMMMIQASDDRSLVKTAYEAAQAITDEKVRAQALLDVVNEINYFTSHQD